MCMSVIYPKQSVSILNNFSPLGDENRGFLKGFESTHVLRPTPLSDSPWLIADFW